MARCQPPPPRTQLENRQATNRTVAIIVPLILIGIVGYVTWVVIVLLCAHYLIHPRYYYDDSGNEVRRPARPGAGIAIIVLYFIFFIPMASAYLRLLSTVPKPGYIEKGTPVESTPVKHEQMPEHNVQHSCTNTKVKGNSTAGANPSNTGAQDQIVTTLDVKSIINGELPPPPGTEKFYSKDIFVCDSNGLPIWCGICCNWKPDRSHHGSDVGHCVLKLDHFCPWVGGIVAERNFNFFIQFTFYTALFTLFVLIVMAKFIAEIKRTGGVLGVNWIVALALAALFFLFTSSMTGSSVFFALNNLTTIDNLGRERRVMHLAVLLNDPSQYHNLPQAPRPSSAPDAASSSPSASDTNPWQGTITYPLSTKPTAPSTTSDSTSSTPNPKHPTRTFAILRTHPGMNPWNLGPFKNFKTVMGNHWYDWFLPLRHSPCCNHDRGDSMYDLGPDIERLKLDAGLSQPRSGSTGESFRRRRRKRSHKSSRDPEDVDIMGSTLANVNGVTGREDVGRREFDDDASDVR